MFANEEAFLKEFKDYERELEEDFEDIVIDVCKHWFTNLVRRTPRDTGFSQMNWHHSINANPPYGSDINPKVRASYKAAKTPSFREFKSGDKVYLYSNVTYIVELEHGKSSQAPSGMLAITTLEAEARLRHALRKL